MNSWTLLILSHLRHAKNFIRKSDKDPFTRKCERPSDLVALIYTNVYGPLNS